MNTKIKLLAPLAFTVFFSGCVGTGPNTQQGAVSGGIIGAIAGAVIGNNSGHGNGATGALIGATAGAIAGGTMGNQVDHQRGTIYRSEDEATSSVEVETEPPPPPPQREVVVIQQDSRTVWIEGYWFYTGREYAWVPGHWESPPPRAHYYVPPHWKRRGHTSIYVRGYWH